MKYYLAFSILLTLFLQSCQDENVPLNQLEFYWDQTGCADPWEVNFSDPESEIENDIEYYLEEEGVVGAKVVSITNDGRQIVCLACTCLTGNRIYVRVPASQKSKMIAIGFMEEN